MLRTTVVVTIILMVCPAAATAEQAVTIIHTNDMHSHLLGSAPNIAYTPSVTGDDPTIGGWARLAAVINSVRQERNNPVLVLDAGDFLMGSLFHMRCREEAYELRLMHAMGYDAATLGNHEFDLKPAGLARILETARRKGQLPPLVMANALFSAQSEEDDQLEALFRQGVIRPYRVLERDGMRIGIFGLIGRNAAEVAPFASPVRFADPVTTARQVVGQLERTERVDMIICLSHGGLDENPDRSEDEILAREVEGIDVIISGHTHTRLENARVVNNTIIVQAWEYGKQVGILDVVAGNGRCSLKNYRMVDVDDTIPADPEITSRIETFVTEIEQQVLSAEGLGFRQIIANSEVDLELAAEESNLGNLIADAIRWSVNRHDPRPVAPATPAAVAVISNGVIRDPICRGATGDIAVCDVFRAIPLGIGFDEAETMGYPLISIYVYPDELKKALEILTSIYPLKGWDYYLQVSGVRFAYNPYRMIFDRVTEIELGDENSGYTPLDYSPSNRRLIRVVADIYNATFLKLIGDFTWHVLDIEPKDQYGRPVEDLKTARVDADPAAAGIQELKEWSAVMTYMQSFPDPDGDGVATVPTMYRSRLGRQQVQASLNPVNLLKRGAFITWAALSLVVLAGMLVSGSVWYIYRKLKRHHRGRQSCQEDTQANTSSSI